MLNENDKPLFEKRMPNDLERVLRLSLVRQRVMQHLSLQSHIARHTGERLSSMKIKQLNSEGLKALLADPNVYLAAEANVSVMQSLNETIEQIEQSVLEQSRTRSHFDSSRLSTSCEIGTLSLEYRIDDARDSLGRSFALYNSKRRHQSLDRQTPASVYYQDIVREAA